jgi:hypothetical protein
MTMPSTVMLEVSVLAFGLPDSCSGFGGGLDPSGGSGSGGLCGDGRRRVPEVLEESR